MKTWTFVIFFVLFPLFLLAQLEEKEGKIYYKGKIVNELFPAYNKTGTYVYYTPIVIGKTGDTTALCPDAYHYKCAHVDSGKYDHFLIKNVTEFRDNKTHGWDLSFDPNTNSVDSSWYQNDVLKFITRSYFYQSGALKSRGPVVMKSVVDTSYIPTPDGKSTEAVIFVGEKLLRKGEWHFYDLHGRETERKTYK